MAISIALGWWIIPALITIAAFGWHIWASRDSRGGLDITPVLTLGAALIIVLVAWLVWALLT